MSKTAIIIKRVADELGLTSRFIDDYKLVLVIDFGNKSHTFIANNIGINDEAVRKICNDKFYTYLLLKNVINLPKTLSFVDPNAEDIYLNQGKLSLNKIEEKIITTHTYPILIKANSLSRGINVFKCLDRDQVKKAIKNIYNQKSKNYDHVLISQDYIDSVAEYRVVVYDQKVQFVYQKDNNINLDLSKSLQEAKSIQGDVNIQEARDLHESRSIQAGKKTQVRKSPKFVGNLSPLHWENSKSVLIDDKNFLTKMSAFIKPVFSKIDLKYAGLDIIEDKLGKLWLIEINSQPGFTYFIRDNSDKEIIKMYRKILLDLRNQI